MNGKITYRQQYTRCGKERCRKCKEGAGHGPYWYAYWSERGRTVSKYIGIHPPSDLDTPDAAPTPPLINRAARLDNNVVPSSSQNALLLENDDRPVEPTLELQEKWISDPALPQPLLRIYLLGQFRVDRREDGEWQTVANRTWQRRRARALLGCLLSQGGRRMGREQVMEALWPDLDIETAANRLNGAVHELRQILEPAIARPAASKMLRLERDILILADASQIWVDVEAFEGLLNKANTIRDPEQVEQMLEQAAALYEGDYLLEELYSEWAAARRESLRRGWMGLLLELAELRAARGALTSAIEPLDRLLTADPTHETAVRRLMVILTQLDRRGEAIRAYQRLATILQRDYENEPLLETVELYQALLQGQIQTTRPLTALSPSGGVQKSNQKETSARPLPSSQLAPATTGTSVAENAPFPRPALALGRQNQSPLIGREREMETIRHMLQMIGQATDPVGNKEQKKRAVPEQSPLLAHTVMLMGEPGIGKTRLAEEISHEALAQGWTVAWTRAYEQEGNIPYRPWTEILRTLLQDISLDQLISTIERGTAVTKEVSGALHPAVTAQTKLHRLSSLIPELAIDQPISLLPNTSLLSLPSEQERLHLWEAMLTLLSALSQPHPLLLVLDDLHWTDDSSLALLAYLARHLQHERIMLICTCRDIELAPSASLRSLLNDLRREQVLLALPLPLLTSAQIEQLISHLPHGIVRSIQGQAGGNPLFAEELARFSEMGPGESGTNGHYAEGLEGKNGRQETNRYVPMPDTIAAVLERRLNKLSSECQALLSKAAVLGGSFEFGLLMRMTGEAGISEDATLDFLEEALRSGLLTEETNSNRITYHFWHPLIVSHLYERLSAARRAQLHRRAAQALIELHAGNEAEVAAAITFHLSKHGSEKTSLAHYAEIAGKKAHTISAYPEALRHYRLAFETLQEIIPPQAQDEQTLMHIASLLECMADCNQIQGNYLEARQQYTRVLELYNACQGASRQSNNAEDWTSLEEAAQIQGILWRSIGRMHGKVGEYEMAHACAKRGKEVLDAAGITTGPAWACLQHLDGSIYCLEGDFAQARQHTQAALDLHQEIRRNASAQRRKYELQQNKANPPARLMTLSRLALLGEPLELGRTHETLGVIAASMAQYNEALQHLTTALTIFEEHDMVGSMSQTCSNLGAVHAMKSEHEVAIAYFKRSLDLTERTGGIPSKVLVTGNLGDLAARTGNLHEAEEWLHQCLSLSEQISDREHTSWCLTTLAIVQQDLGNARGALEKIRRALVVGRKVKSTIRVGFALVVLAGWRVNEAIQRFTPEDELLEKPAGEAIPLLLSARTSVERALALDGIDAETRCIGLSILATIHYLLNDLDKAHDQTIQALEITRQNEMAYVTGRLQRLLAEIYTAMQRHTEAESAFQQTLEFFQERGLLLDYGRTAQKYGAFLLQRSQQVHQKGTREGLQRQATSYLSKARDIFETTRASIDLQRVERLLAHPIHK